jgi:hypothetical protein
MDHPNARTLPSQFLRRFLLGEHLPFATMLSIEEITRVLTEELGVGINCIYTPLVTLALFLRQVVDADHSCQAAVEHLAAARVALGLKPCSEDTGAYCKARQRLPLSLFQRLVHHTGGRLQRHAPEALLFHGRSVKIVDGTGCSMPDTPANRGEFPRPGGQKPGVGFPMARVLVVLSLACGAVLTAAISRCRGKQTGECAALRGLHDHFEPGDIALGDSLYGTFLDIALLAARDVDVIFGLHARRAVDFRRGRRLGREDHVVDWVKPRRPAWMDQPTYEALPATLAIRELRLRVERAGFRTRVVLIATTLLDATMYSKAELTGLSRARWHAELDIRSLKQSLAMDVLRCHSPEMVSKEIWAHLLAYNLIRTAMTAAALGAGLRPRQLSFQGARQTLEAFAEELKGATATTFSGQVGLILGRLAAHRVGDRPDRFEPRERKRRPKPSKYMRFPRKEARRLAALRD